mmetsp:Transcript_52061/g.153570  ORF Transcript_52061/g.153570 Transcript_52061/m.153570 type:complete len:264 (+) Transcript_52061:992-1783(+)
MKPVASPHPVVVPAPWPRPSTNHVRPSEPIPSGVISGVCTRMRRPESFVRGSPVGEAMVAVRRPSRDLPGMHMSPQPAARSSNVKPGGAMISSSRMTALPWSMLSVTSMIAIGGLRCVCTVSAMRSTGVKPWVAPSFVFVKPMVSMVSKRHVLVPGLGNTRIVMEYGVSFCSATSDAGRPGSTVTRRAPNWSSTVETWIWPMPMITKGEVRRVYAPSPWHVIFSVCCAFTFCENERRKSAVASSLTRGWKRDFTGYMSRNSLY